MCTVLHYYRANAVCGRTKSDRVSVGFRLLRVPTVVAAVKTRVTASRHDGGVAVVGIKTCKIIRSVRPDRQWIEILPRAHF